MRGNAITLPPMPAKPPKYRLGVDLGGTKIYAVVIDRKGRVIGSSKAATKPHKGYQRVMQRVAAVASDALDDADLRRKDVHSIGIGAPGPIDSDRGVALFCPNLGWVNKPIAKDLASELGMRVVLGNDVNFGALGEVAYGAAMNARSAFSAFVGTGLGGGVILDGQVVNGAHGFGGEIGHVPYPESDALCGCGRRHCLETVASKSGVMRLITEARRAGRRCMLTPTKMIKSSEISAALKKGDPVVKVAINRMTDALAWGLSSVGNLLDPEVYIIGGGLGEALGKPLLERVSKRMIEYSELYRRQRPRLVMAKLGDGAVAIGAAVAAGMAKR